MTSAPFPCRESIRVLVERLVAEHAPGVDVRLRWVQRGGCRVRPAGRGMVLVADEAQLAQEPRMAPFWVAHEVGHIALGHVRRRRLYTVMLLLFLPLLVGPLVVAFAGGRPTHLGLAAAAGVLIWPFILRWQVRPGEVAADRFAARVGCPLDPGALEAYLKGHGWIDENAGGWLGSHPDWATRLRIAQQNTSASDET